MGAKKSISKKGEAEAPVADVIADALKHADEHGAEPMVVDPVEMACVSREIREANARADEEFSTTKGSPKPIHVGDPLPAVRFEGSMDNGVTWGPVDLVAGRWPVGMIVRRLG